jgi:hypothetical protein
MGMTLAEMIYAVSNPIPMPQTIKQKALDKLRRRYSYDEAKEYYRKAHEIRHDEMTECLGITSHTARRLIVWSEMAELIEYVRTDGAVKVYRRKT